jgi:hypothetical protein
MPAVVSFMLLSLTGSCFLYSTSMIDSLDATPMVSLACIIFVAAAALLSFPNGKEEEKELKNRIWLLVFFVVQLETSVVLQIVKEAVDIEKELMCESLPVSLIGMHADEMSKYIEFVADHLLCQLGLEKLYNMTNPFDFMENMSGRCVGYSTS